MDIPFKPRKPVTLGRILERVTDANPGLAAPTIGLKTMLLRIDDGILCFVAWRTGRTAVLILGRNMENILVMETMRCWLTSVW